MEIKEEDVSVSRLKLMTQTPNSRLKRMTQEQYFLSSIKPKRGTNKAWVVSHDMMQMCPMHEGIPLELHPMLKLLETCWRGIHTTWTSPTCVRETTESQVQEVFLSPKGGGNSSTTAIPTTTACS